MRVAAFASLLLSLSVGVGSAWAEQARGSRGADAASARAIRAEQRSRIITTEICRGCGVTTHVRQDRRLRKPGLRTARRSSRLPISSVGAPSQALPLTSRAESQIHDLNRLNAGQQQMLRYEQQTQFELNQLRYEIGRDYLFR
jgi:hypothetical protein